MKGYKGFDEDLKCKGKQYAVGVTHKEDTADLCKSGMHFCENPIEVFDYYPPSDSRYCEVEADDVTDQTEGDSKRTCKTLKVTAETGIIGVVKAFVEFTLSKINRGNNKDTNTGYQSAAANTGDQSAAANTGYQSAAANTGDRSAATNTGSYSAATNTGYQSAAANTGDQSAAANTGYQSAAANTGSYSAAANTGSYSAATNTGYQSAATNTGDRSAATNTGDQSAATVEGNESVAIAIGAESKAKGAKGCYIVLAEWGESDGGMHLKTVKARKVDGKKIKAGVFYTLADGKFVEAE